MEPVQSRFVHFAQAWVALTGLAYAFCLYLLKPEDPYAVVNHPLQPHLQHLHLLGAPVLVFAVGWIWEGHALGKLRSGTRKSRWSGLGLLGLFVPMALSGYFIQVLVEEGWRKGSAWAHLALSLLWCGAYLGHWNRAIASRNKNHR